MMALPSIVDIDMEATPNVYSVAVCGAELRTAGFTAIAADFNVLHGCAAQRK